MLSGTLLQGDAPTTFTRLKKENNAGAYYDEWCLHDHKVIAKFLHECSQVIGLVGWQKLVKFFFFFFTHRSMLLGVPQH